MRLFVVLSLGLVVAFAVVQAHADTDQLRDTTNLDNPNKNDADEKVRSKKVRGRVRTDKDDDDKDKRKRVRVQNEDKTRNSDSPVKEQRQSCPGKCIRSDASCKGGRVLKNACKKGICCITGAKKEREMDTDPKRARAKKERQMDTDPKGASAKRRCKPLESCTILNGECVKSKKYCKPGQVSVTSKDGLFCSKPNCKCCYMKEGGGCEPTAKCLKKKGHCVKDECHSGKAKMGPKWCTGAGCKCCLPKCVTKKKCTKANGECKPKHECHGEWKEHKKLCKGNTCGCCISDDGETWSYLKEENGVSQWPDLFPFCGLERQSPVALVTEEAGGEYPWMPFNFKNYDTAPTKTKIKNEGGHTAKVEIEQDPIPTLLGGDLGHAYTFLQFHFHWGADDTRGSEHTVDGKVYPAELHLVHFRTDYGDVANAVQFSDGLAVLGIFLEISDEDNPNLKNIIDGLPDITVHDTMTEITPFPLRYLLPCDTTGFFRYLGSLTTPPCSEVVIWTVFKDVIKISRSQLAVFRTLFDKHGDPLVDNFRPTQPLFGREVLMNAETPYWAYNEVFGDFGPDNWEDFFPMCGGQAQSPIALENPSQINLPLNPFVLTNFDKTPKVMHIENNGHGAEVTFEMEDGVDIPSFTQGGLGTDRYIVAQFHFHWGSKISQGSEHTINGARFPAELHIVGFNSKYDTISNAIRFRDGLAVLGVMLTPSNTNNNNLNSIITGLGKIIDAETEAEIEAFPLNQILPFNLLTFYRYQGSLTTPGCSEVVTWTVFTDKISVGDAQLEAFRKLVDDLWLPLVDNFRPLQERNGRDLILFGK